MAASAEYVTETARQNSAFRLNGRVPELDGVRGLAILLVLIYHYADVIPTPNSFARYAVLPTHLMWSGVDLFFVLSGLLIGGILIDHKESENYFGAFYGRRIFRIFPLYYALACGLALGTFLFPASAMFQTKAPIWTFFLFGQNIASWFTSSFGTPPWSGVTWSLAVEEQFYLLLPLFIWLFSPRALVRLTVGCLIGAPLLRAALIFDGHTLGQVQPLLPCRADALGFGVLAAIILRSPSLCAWIRSHATHGFTVFLALLLALPSLLKWTTYRFVGTLGYSLLGSTFFVLIVLLLLAPTKSMKRAFSMKWLRWLGTVSYCIYLIHIPIRYGIFHLFDRTNPAWAAAIAVALTLALARMSWPIEKRLIDFAHARYRYQLPPHSDLLASGPNVTTGIQTRIAPSCP